MLSPSRPRRILEAIIGESVSATKPEKATAMLSVTLNSANMRPVSPGMKATGTNTLISTNVVATTAKATWRVPLKAATSGCSPCSMRRWMFSSTTIASSTTNPIASTKASSVSVFIE